MNCLSKPISYWVVRTGSMSKAVGTEMKFCPPSSRASLAPPANMERIAGICEKRPYWTWKTVASDTGNEKPSRGVISWKVRVFVIESEVDCVERIVVAHGSPADP